MQGADPTSPTVTDALGFKFELYGSATDTSDPQNLTNEVISMTSLPAPVVGVALRKLNPGVKIDTLTNQIQLKYYLPSPRVCDGGSPRIQLHIDPGDGTPPRNAFGYVGHAGFGAGCVQNAWDFVDMTDGVVARWDASQFGGGYPNWAGLVAFFNLTYPNHKVLSGALVDDSGSFIPAAGGLAYYDLVTIGHRTLENWQDTVHP